ncbi:hypothetical protein ND861_11460 [Leptospira sp. 2 VSF19]|uniref:Uncharacterized protein n=1 Tax=Leptospira soteropolitanensis TaxID=2950025 RepID=A0AAW5VGC9_9LEPT|nr:hypothetical protein [Leptospira soteropolitanensis]MCW7493078.1 hypothetical protein [Leptospira soteropolitanensis]MCW7500853.1 hypothetical protein [Leptospira soteropolitanensis]MCW7522928.1 hypothetical protein [Leptospira soteropolitanensis]MCW7526965.1 hypothetical protein [Leptospira soteropolitanensis]MCW7530646.1 hypothetical protein [Leptospira soteropolitanensis]
MKRFKRSLILLLVISFPLLAEWFPKSKSFDEVWNAFDLHQNLISQAYGIQTRDLIRTETAQEEEDFLYYWKLCSQTEIKDLTEILRYVSFYDAMLTVKYCSEFNKEELLLLEKQTKKKIFDLIVLPKLEILESEITSPDLIPLVADLQKEWEKTVYVFSNLYKAQEVLLLGKEREYTLAINRVLYSDMPETRRKTLILRLLQDMKQQNKSSYQLFYYSKQNPWTVSSLKEENSESKKFYLSLIEEWQLDPEFSQENKSMLKEFQVCLEEIPVNHQKIRLLGFFGFFSDYGRFTTKDQTDFSQANQTRVRFIRQTLFRSHHFQKRLENVLASCKNSVQSLKDL